MLRIEAEKKSDMFRQVCSLAKQIEDPVTKTIAINKLDYLFNIGVSLDPLKAIEIITPDDQRMEIHTPTSFLAQSGHSEAVMTLVRRYGTDLDRAVRGAAQAKNLGLVIRLIELGASSYSAFEGAAMRPNNTYIVEYLRNINPHSFVDDRVLMYCARGKAHNKNEDIEILRDISHLPSLVIIEIDKFLLEGFCTAATESERVAALMSEGIHTIHFRFSHPDNHDLKLQLLAIGLQSTARAGNIQAFWRLALVVAPQHHLTDWKGIILRHGSYATQLDDVLVIAGITGAAEGGQTELLFNLINFLPTERALFIDEALRAAARGGQTYLVRHLIANYQANPDFAIMGAVIGRQFSLLNFLCQTMTDENIKLIGKIAIEQGYFINDTCATRFIRFLSPPIQMALINHTTSKLTAAFIDSMRIMTACHFNPIIMDNFQRLYLLLQFGRVKRVPTSIVSKIATFLSNLIEHDIAGISLLNFKKAIAAQTYYKKCRCSFWYKSWHRNQGTLCLEAKTAERLASVKTNTSPR